MTLNYKSKLRSLFLILEYPIVCSIQVKLILKHPRNGAVKCHFKMTLFCSFQSFHIFWNQMCKTSVSNLNSGSLSKTNKQTNKIANDFFMQIAKLLIYIGETLFSFQTSSPSCHSHTFFCYSLVSLDIFPKSYIQHPIRFSSKSLLHYRLMKF